MTYVWTWEGWLFLAVILDVFSRKVVGWTTSERTEHALAVQALQIAIRTRRPAPGLVHHSDRGAQYACGDYTKLLQGREIRISMSRKGNPYDNAKAESFMKTLKSEEVHRVEYRDLADARRGIRNFLERTYNRKRLHSALGYRPPAQFDCLPPAEKLPA